MRIPVEVPDIHIKKINVNGLNGRMIHIPSVKKKKVIIYIQGMHAAVERHYSLCDFLSDFGEVYAPDLPGMGGMDSFYKINRVPTYDNFADYLYTVIKSLNIPSNRKICFVGISFGSQVMTRMLQKHPSLVKNAQVLSIAGYGSGDNFKTLRSLKTLLYPTIWLGRKKIPSRLIRLLMFNPLSLRFGLWMNSFFAAKYKHDTLNSKHDILDMEYYLWRIDDFRTHSSAGWLTFHGDLTAFKEPKIPLKLQNISVDADQYFDHEKVEATFRALYEDYESAFASSKAHAPSLVANKQAIGHMFPAETIKLLKS